MKIIRIQCAIAQKGLLVTNLKRKRKNIAKKLFFFSMRVVKSLFKTGFLLINQFNRYFCKMKNIFIFQAKPDSWGFRKFVQGDYLRNRAAQWLPNDTLTIVCDVSIVGRESKFSENYVCICSCLLKQYIYNNIISLFYEYNFLYDLSY